MSDLWSEATRDYVREDQERAFESARLKAVSVWTFLAAAKSVEEYNHRKALVEDRLDAIATGSLRKRLEASLDRDFRIVLAEAEEEAKEAEASEESDSDEEAPEEDDDDDSEDDSEESDSEEEESDDEDSEEDIEAESRKQAEARPYDPLDPDSGLPKECVVCGETPVKTYTDEDGRKMVLCSNHADIAEGLREGRKQASPSSEMEDPEDVEVTDPQAQESMWDEGWAEKAAEARKKIRAAKRARRKRAADSETCGNCGKDLKPGEEKNCDVCRGFAYPTARKTAEVPSGAYSYAVTQMREMGRTDDSDLIMNAIAFDDWYERTREPGDVIPKKWEEYKGLFLTGSRKTAYFDVIETRDLGTINSFEIQAQLLNDYDITPDFYGPGSVYDNEEVMAAWRNDDWTFVTVGVTASRGGTELGSAYLGGMEYGHFPGVGFIDPLDDAPGGYPWDELIAEAIDEANNFLARNARKATRKTASDIATCGTCGLSWDDSISTSMTPAPSGRCPFEYFHEYHPDDSDFYKYLEPEDIPEDWPVQPYIIGSGPFRESKRGRRQSRPFAGKRRSRKTAEMTSWGDILTGRRAECHYCGEEIVEVQDPSSFVIDWASTDSSGNPVGDFGCSSHPGNDDEGTYGHTPVADPERPGYGRFSKRKTAEKIKAKDLKVGDQVDLSGDQYAYDDEDPADIYDYEYAVVAEIFNEGTAIAVNFVHQGGEVFIGFPPDHELEVNERLGESYLGRRKTANYVDIGTFTQGMADALVFVGVDWEDQEDGNPTPLDQKGFSSSDIDASSMARLRQDAQAFVSQAQSIIDTLPDADDYQMGIDFVFTAGGQGAGFWDGDYPEPQASQLTDIAHGFRNTYEFGGGLWVDGDILRFDAGRKTSKVRKRANQGVLAEIYYTGTLITPDDSGTNVYGEPTDPDYGESMEDGWVEPDWSLFAVWPNKSDVKPDIIDESDLEFAEGKTLEQLVEETMSDRLGAFDSWDGQTAYAADSIQDYSSGESMMLAAHVTYLNGAQPEWTEVPKTDPNQSSFF